MNTITVFALNALLNKNPNLPVFDVRTPVEYTQVHLKHARNIPLDQLDPNEIFARNRWPKDHIIYLICQSGQRSGQAAKLFQNEGFARAVIVEEGVSAWIKAGFEVERGQSKVISLERQVRIGAGFLVLLGIVLSHIVHPVFIWISIFVGLGLINAGVTDWCGMGLLLARFPWNKVK